MVSEIGNKTFLYRMEFVLGQRKKHRWGEPLGISSARIDAIFKGRMPQADALEVIHRAERVRIDWLVTGEGNPYTPCDCRLRQEWCLEQLAASLDDASRWVIHVLHDGQGHAAAVLTQPVRETLEGGLVARYVRVEAFAFLDRRGLDLITRRASVRVGQVSYNDLEQLAQGEIGSRQLLGDDDTPGLLSGAREGPATGVMEQAVRYDSTPPDEARLIGHYRRMSSEQRAALLVIATGLDRTIDLRQAPPGGVISPDSESEGETVKPDHQLPATDKI